jgi:hypothetical protein
MSQFGGAAPRAGRLAFFSRGIAPKLMAIKAAMHSD